MSLLNGLSALGSGVAAYAGTAGLEAQKAALQQQSLQLADQLQGARESAGRQEAGQIQATATGIQNQFMAGQNDLTRANQVATTKISAGATLGAASMESAATVRSAQIAATADPPEVKLLNYLRGINSAAPVAPSGVGTGGGVGPSGGSVPAPSSSSSGASGAPASGSAGAPSASGAPAPMSGSVINGSPATPGSSVTGSAAPLPGASPLANMNIDAVVAKALGLPMQGSEQQIRSAIADGINHDPRFANSTPAQKAIETETQFAVASGKMIDPALRPALVDGIVHYKIAPFEGRGLSIPGAPDVMTDVLKADPTYQASFFPAVQKTFADFTSGAEAAKIRTINAAAQHMDVFDQAVMALNNDPLRISNQVKNAWAATFGSPIPTTLDALKGLVSGEVQSAVTGGLGTESDREQIQGALNRANSIPQLLDATQHFRQLLGGQASALQTQYEDGTHIRDPQDPFSFQHKLQPATIKAMNAPLIDYSQGMPGAANAASLPRDDATPSQLYGGTRATPAPTPARPQPAAPPAPSTALQSLWGQ